MIVVIADDLTGAAEVAGAAHQRGYAAEVHRKTFFGGAAEVVAVDAQTRSLDPSRARRLVTDLTQRILASNLGLQEGRLTALQDARGPQPRPDARVPDGRSRATPPAKTLFLRGSAAAWAASREKQCQTQGVLLARRWPIAW